MNCKKWRTQHGFECACVCMHACVCVSHRCILVSVLVHMCVCIDFGTMYIQNIPINNGYILENLKVHTVP